MSIGYLLERHAKGQAIPGKVVVKDPLYLEMKVPTFSDLTDAERYLDVLNEQKKEVQNLIKEDKKRAEQKRKAEEAERKKKAESEAKGSQLTIESDEAKV